MLFIITVSIPNAFYTSLPRFPEPHTNTHSYPKHHMHTYVGNTHLSYSLFFYLSLLLFSVWCFIFSFTLMRYFVFILCCTATTYLSTQVQTYLQTYYQQQQNIYICGLVRCNIWLCVWNHSDSVLQSSYTYECVCCLHTYTTSHLPSRVIHPFIHPSRPYIHPSVYPFYTHIPIHVSKLTA